MESLIKINLVPNDNTNDDEPKDLIDKEPKTSSLLNNSKKIKKMNIVSSGDKKYETVDSKIKKKIIIDIKKTMIQLKKLKTTHEQISPSEVKEYLERVAFTTYNKLLTDVLSNNLISFKPTPQALAHWRRKIKNWLKNADKPETRGGVLIGHTVIHIFRKRVINVLKTMKTRAFQELRKKLLEILEEIHYSIEENQGKEFNNKVCSKHWWFNFMRKNPDIKALWESIPLSRTTPNKIKPIFQNELNSSTTPSHNETSLTSPTSQIKIEIPILTSSQMLIEEQEQLKKSIFNQSLFKSCKIEEGSTVASFKDFLVKKEEEKFQTVLASIPLMCQKLAPKIEDEANSVQIIVKKEEENMKTGPENVSQTQEVSQLQTPISIDPLEILWRQRRTIDLLIAQVISQGNLQKMSMNMNKRKSNNDKDNNNNNEDYDKAES